MALKEARRHTRITASGGGTLVAPAHESYRIRDIFCVGSTNDTYLTVLSQSRTVGKFRVVGLSGNHLPYPAVKTTQLYESTFGGLLAWLRARGIDLSFPLAKGETLTLSRYAEAGDVTLVYDAFDADDVKATEPNGSEAKVSRYLHYLTNSAAITASPCAFDTSLIWAGGEAWPVGGIEVPSGVTIRLLGIFGAPASRGNASANKGYTTYLKLLLDGDVLFDDGTNGLPFVGDVAQTADAAVYTPVASVIGPLTAAEPYPPFLLDSPLVFRAGQKLTVQALLTGAASGGLAASQLDLALLLERTVAA
jgi:hypothetical protein